MPTVPDGVGYKDGRVYRNEVTILEFEPWLNPDLVTLFTVTYPSGALVGLEYDLSGLPDSFDLDGGTYPINYADDAPIFAEVHALNQSLLGLSAADSKAYIRAWATAIKAWWKGAG